MIINKIRKYFKQLLGENIEIINSDCSKENFPKSLKNFTDNNPDILENYSQFGKRKDKKEFYPAIKKIEDGFNLLYKELPEYDDKDYIPVKEMFTVRTGNPMISKPFPMSKEYIIRIALNKYLFRYPEIEGNNKSRSHFVNYLIREGFKKDKDDNYDGLGIENIVFACSTTHAFNMILGTILRDEDVVIMTGPNYGLFAVDPERMNGKVEILNLKEEDNFLVNPKDLAKKIDEINSKLKKEFEGKLDYIPRVVAFLNMNPHNPLGKVMNSKNVEILKGIGDVCLEKGVFVIDDLIYRDLTFDQNDLAIPMASFPKYFNNTISLFGLSKAYGLASIRAGAIVAPIPIARGISEKIFSTMDSMPVFQVQALAGAYNGTNRRYKIAKKYFPPLIKEYKHRFNVLLTLLEGIDKIEDQKEKNKIIHEINKYEKNKKTRNVLLKGIDGIKIRKNTIPESGFFAVVDFTGLKGKKIGDILVKNETDLIRALYRYGKFKTIMGQNMSWPYEDEMIGRFNFAIEINHLINNIKMLHKALGNDYE